MPLVDSSPSRELGCRLREAGIAWSHLAMSLDPAHFLGHTNTNRTTGVMVMVGTMRVMVMMMMMGAAAYVSHSLSHRH